VKIKSTVAAWAAIAISLSSLWLAVPSLQAEEKDSSFEIEEFSFDVDEFKKSPWTLDGYVEGDFFYVKLNSDSAFYRFTSAGKDRKNHLLQGGLEVQAGLTYQKGPFKVYALGDLRERYDGEDWDEDVTLFEGNLSWHASDNSYLVLGKTLVRWGKGYAWNPTNFVGRDKNPSDPNLALEGYWMGVADIVKSLSGPLKTLAFTGVVLPVSDDVNSSFGRNDHVNVAGKIYLLLYDTDIDVMALSEGSKSARYGLTASRNVTSNFEVHGELAFYPDFQKPVFGSDGLITTEKHDAWDYLAGIRYLTSTETTFIFEYYHNGKGYAESEVEEFFAFIDEADNLQFEEARPAVSNYQAPNYMRNYLYLRASQKEPFGWLYVTPAIFTIYNLDDRSFNLVPEVTYTGVENVELRFRFNYLSGDDGTEYGEKLNDWRAEIRVRYYF
jgi:hypothetical protein